MSADTFGGDMSFTLECSDGEASGDDTSMEFQWVESLRLTGAALDDVSLVHDIFPHTLIANRYTPSNIKAQPLVHWRNFLFDSRQRWIVLIL